MAGVTSSTTADTPNWEFAILRMKQINNFAFRWSHNSYKSITDGSYPSIKYFAFDGELHAFGTFESVALRRPANQNAGVWLVSKKNSIAQFDDV